MTSTQVEVNEQGRVTIPAAIRNRLGLRPGSRLTAREEDGRVVLESPGQRLSRLQGHLAAASAAAGYGPDDSVVDELITERRAEAAREAAQ
jgi:AbrB family looped-hinge helix DNA binding protein